MGEVPQLGIRDFCSHNLPIRFMKQLFYLPLLVLSLLCTCALAPNSLSAQPNIAVSSPADYITKLQDIFVDDDGVGFAGGRCGVLLKTVTDGQMWEPVAAPTTSDILTLACPPSGCSTAIMDTPEGLFRLSNDTWTPIISDNGSLGGTLHWLSESTLVHEINGDSYFRSTDGGLTWKATEFSFFQRANMTFLDADTGFVWIDKDLYKTTDGANVFSPVGYTHPEDVREQTWLNDQIGWIFGADRLFYKTTDGGLSWTVLNETSQLTSVNWMVALSETHLVGAQITTSRLESLDGGVTWTRESFLDGGNERVNERYHRRGDAFFTIGDANQIMYSPAGFTDFVELDPIERHDRISRIVFHTPEIGYAADGSQLMRTTDGINWTYLTESFGFIQDLTLLPDGSIVVLNSSMTRISTDQGETFTDWVPDGLVAPGEYGSKFSQKPNGDIYLLGSEFATTSSDGGATWTVVNHGTELSFHGIQWITDDIGYAYTRQQDFAKTTDGGLSWTVGEAAVRNLEGMYFLDEMNGWTSTASRRYRTTDGGDNWLLEAGGGGYDFEINPDDGSLLVASYLGGNNGSISRSTDQGQTWRQLNFNCFAYRAGAVTPDGAYYWTGGDGFLVRHDLKELIEISNSTLPSRQTYRSLKAYPNPSNGLFTIDLPLVPTATTMQVFDLSGRQVQQLQVAPGTERQAVDLSAIPAGVYVVRWLAGGDSGRVKVVVR